uniref:Uncharacterized protein n=1 Tax=Arundo donax TaxID=35708 RepID=A0A0A9FY83_ARUDO
MGARGRPRTTATTLSPGRGGSGSSRRCTQPNGHSG